MDTNKTNETYDYAREEFVADLVHAIGIIELIVFIFGTPVNLLVLYLACTIIRRRRKKHSQWFILTMTIFDLLFCLTHAPISCAHKLFKIQLSLFWCEFSSFCTTVSTTGSSLSLLLLNIDKFLQLYKPLHYPTLVTKKRAIFASVLVSLIAISWGIFWTFAGFYKHFGNCYYEVAVTDGYLFNAYLSSAVIVFILPILVSLVISILICGIVRKSRAGTLEISNLKGGGRNSNDPIQSESVALGKRDYSKTQSRIKFDLPPQNGGQSRWKKFGAFWTDFRIIGFVFITTIWSSITCLPYRISYLFKLKDIVQWESVFVVFPLLPMNAVGNPIVTVITQHQYTVGVKNLIRKVSGQETLNSVSTQRTKSAMSLKVPARQSL